MMSDNQSLFLGSHFSNGAGQQFFDKKTDPADDFSKLVLEAKEKNYYVVQLIRAADGCRTDYVVMPLVDLLITLQSVPQDDFVLVLHQSDFENFSLFPLVTVSSFLKINGIEVVPNVKESSHENV